VVAGAGRVVVVVGRGRVVVVVDRGTVVVVDVVVVTAAALTDVVAANEAEPVTPGRVGVAADAAGPDAVRTATVKPTALVTAAARRAK
jgi:hypothetical protein